MITRITAARAGVSCSPGAVDAVSTVGISPETVEGDADASTPQVGLSPASPEIEKMQIAAMANMKRFMIVAPCSRGHPIDSYIDLRQQLLDRSPRLMPNGMRLCHARTMIRPPDFTPRCANPVQDVIGVVELLKHHRQHRGRIGFTSHRYSSQASLPAHVARPQSPESKAKKIAALPTGRCSATIPLAAFRHQTRGAPIIHESPGKEITPRVSKVICPQQHNNHHSENLAKSKLRFCRAVMLM